jgi:hypothetical protein
MKLLKQRDEQWGEDRYTIIFSDADMVAVNLDNFDRLLLDSCQKDEANIADVLLGLELIARRLIEQHERQR